MECKHCGQEIPEDVQVCVNCGGLIISDEDRSWHSLHNLLWGNKINQDILETLNELNIQNKHFTDVARKIKKTNKNRS